jgi:hypothetical protein
MGFDTYDVHVNNVEIGRMQTFPVERQYLKNLFTRRWGGNLNTSLRIVREFTELTGREVAIDFYTSFNASSSQKMRISTDNLVVPALGCQEMVFAPRMTGKEREYDQRELLYVPLVHVHTHPGGSWPSPSEQDLRSVHAAKSHRYKVKSHEFTMHTPAIQVITGMGNGSLFYRLTGDEDAFWSFFSDYLSKPVNMREDEAAAMMNESGAFVAHSYRKPCNSLVGKEALEDIAEKFAHEVKVTRHS